MVKKPVTGMRVLCDASYSGYLAIYEREMKK